MTDENTVVFAKVLDGKGGATNHDALSEALIDSQPAWFHFDANHDSAADTIRRAFKDIDEYSLQAIFDEDARPRILPLENGTLIILRGVNHNDGDTPEDMPAIRLWVTEKRVISLRYRKSLALMKVAELLDNGRGAKNIGEIITAICSLLFSYIETTISRLADNMDTLEARVLDNPDKQLRKDIAEIRKSAILLRRYIAPQKEVMNQLRYADIDWLTTKHARRIQETQDTLLRSIEDLDAIRERSQVVKDELVNTLSDNLNRNLYVISVVTAIFLPLGFLTGLFGINIGGMPGVDEEMAFTIFAAILAIIVVFQIVLFKYFKWF